MGAGYCFSNSAYSFEVRLEPILMIAVAVKENAECFVKRMNVVIRRYDSGMNVWLNY